MLGLDPTKLAQMQAVSKNIKARIEIDYTTNVTTLAFTTDDPAAAALIPNLMEQFSGALATQLSTFFSITGELVETGKEPK